MPQHRANGHTAVGAPDASVPMTTPSGNATSPPAHRLQNEWLRRMRGKAIAIRLGSGEVISGVLDGDDTYTLTLRVPDSQHTALVYKHSIEYLVANTTR